MSGSVPSRRAGCRTSRVFLHPATACPPHRTCPIRAHRSAIAEWSLSATQPEGFPTKFEGNSELNSTIDLNVTKEMKGSKNASAIEYSFSVKDNEGQSVVKRGSIPIEQVTIQKKREEKLADKIIDRYSLILFDFDKADFDKRNQSILTFIKKRISPDARISIIGSTDRTGDEEHNTRLAQTRANATAQALGLTANVENSKGAQQFSDSTPEGRFYNRTVEILVETAVK